MTSQHREELVALIVAFLLGVFAASRVFTYVAGPAFYAPTAWSAFGADLLVVGVLGLAIALVLRLVSSLIGSGVPPSVAVRSLRTLFGAALAVVGAYLVMNAVSLHLTDAPLSWGTLKGEEGATLADVDLVPVVPLTTGLLALLFVEAALVASFLYGPRGPARALGAWRANLALVVVGTTLLAIGPLRSQPLALEQNPLIAFSTSFLRDLGRPGRALSPAEWAALERARTPKPERAPPPALPAARPKNAIVWLAEGVPVEYSSFGPHKDSTPNLKRRADAAGLRFTRWMAPFHKSIHAIFSLVCSEYPPPYHKAMTLQKPRIDCGTPMESMERAGFRQGLFHGGYFNFSDKLSLLGGRGFDVAKDAGDFVREKKAWGNKWGTDDRVMVDGLLDWIDQQPKDERFFALAIPITPHMPRDLPPDWERPWPGDEDAAKYYSGVRFSDEVFERLMTGLEERGLLDDTVVLYLADHGETIEEPDRPSTGSRQAYQNDLHVPAVLFHPGTFTTATTTDRLATHLDFAPTLLDLLGLPLDARHRGQSLFSPTYAPKRAFVAAHQGGTATVGWLDGDEKVLWNARTERTEIYDLASDPEELVDLAEQRPAQALAYAVEARTYRGAQLARLRDAPVKKEEPVEDRVLRRADVQIVAGKDVVACAKDVVDGRRACPAPYAAGARIRQEPIKRYPRHCLLVETPGKGARLRLVITDPAILERVALLHLAVLDALFDGDETVHVRVEASAGGKSLASVRTTAKQQERLLNIPGAARERGELVLDLDSSEPTRACVALSEQSWN